MNNIVKIAILIFILILVSFFNKSEGFVDAYNNNIKDMTEEDYTAYVINLDTRQDRMEKIMNHFNGKLNLKRFNAIKDKEGWKGCGMSHVAIVQKAKDEGLPTVLVIEDDCEPTEHFDKWPEIKKWLDTHKDQWDLFVGGNSYYAWNNNQSKTVKPICKLNTISLYKTKSQAAHFCYWNSSAYDAFLEYPVIEAVDLWPNRQNLKIVTSTPFIAVQAKNFSNINNKEEDYSGYFDTSEKKIATINNVTECFKNLLQ